MTEIVTNFKDYFYKKGYHKAIEDFEKMIDNIDTQYPDDDGEPFEVLACNYVKELKEKLDKLKEKQNEYKQFKTM